MKVSSHNMMGIAFVAGILPIQYALVAQRIERPPSKR